MNNWANQYELLKSKPVNLIIITRYTAVMNYTVPPTRLYTVRNREARNPEPRGLIISKAMFE